MRGVVGHLGHHPARRGDRRDQGEALDRDGVGARRGRGDRVSVGQQSGGGRGVGVDPGGARGGLDVPGVGGAQDGDAHDVATFSRPRSAEQVEFGVAAQRAGDPAQLLQGLAAGRDAQEVLGGGRPPLGQPGGGHRRPAGLEGVVEQVAVAEVLDEEPVGVAPVVEDLAALDVPPDAPGPLVAVLAQVLAARGERVEVRHLVGGVHVPVGRAQRHGQRVVVGRGRPAVAADEAHHRSPLALPARSRGSR